MCCYNLHEIWLFYKTHLLQKDQHNNSILSLNTNCTTTAGDFYCFCNFYSFFFIQNPAFCSFLFYFSIIVVQFPGSIHFIHCKKHQQNGNKRFWTIKRLWRIIKFQDFYWWLLSFFFFLPFGLNFFMYFFRSFQKLLKWKNCVHNLLSIFVLHSYIIILKIFFYF